MRFLHDLEAATDELFRQAVQAANAADASHLTPAEAEMAETARNASAEAAPVAASRSAVPDRATLRADALIQAIAAMGAELPDDDASERHLVVLHVAVDAFAAPDGAEHCGQARRYSHPTVATWPRLVVVGAVRRSGDLQTDAGQRACRGSVSWHGRC